MKTFIATLLLFIYSCANAGAVLQYHYCGGKLVYISNLDTDKNCCDILADGCADLGDTDSCCDDKYEIIKTDLATKSQLNFNLSTLYLGVSVNDNFVYSIDSYFLTNEPSIVSILPNPPPLLGAITPLFILYRNQKLDC